MRHKLISTFIFGILVFSLGLSNNLVHCQESDDSILNYWSFKYDFSIGGDFNADGKEDVIKIKHQSMDSVTDLPTITYKSIEEKRTKYCELNPKLMLLSENGLSSLLLSDSCNYSETIVLFNLGDLNGNGGDEIAILLDGFYETAPYFQVYTYCNKSWQLVNNFKMYYKEEFGEYIHLDNLMKEDKNYVLRWYIDENGNQIEMMSSEYGC